MEPIQILEGIRNEIRDKFDNDLLMMRTVNMVIYEFETRTKQLHKLSVMQAEGSDGAEGAAVGSEGAGEANTCADCGRTKDEDGTCYSCEYGAMFGH